MSNRRTARPNTAAQDIVPGNILDGNTVTGWERGQINVHRGGFERVRSGGLCRITLADGSTVVYRLMDPVTITRP